MAKNTGCTHPNATHVQTVYEILKDGKGTIVKGPDGKPIQVPIGAIKKCSDCSIGKFYVDE